MKGQIRQRFTLALLLLTLHGVLVWGFYSAVTQTLLLIHYGLFLLWQPIWRGEQKLGLLSSGLFVAGGVLLVYSVNWWILAFWLAGLFGLLGGRVFSASERFSRISYMLAAAYLLGMLLMWVVPKLLDKHQEIAEIHTLTVCLMPLLPAALFLIRVEYEQVKAEPIIDLFYSLMLFLLAAILILGSFALQSFGDIRYVEALMQILFAMAAAMIVLSWLWNPRAGFSGLGQLLSRYLLTVGMPFEDWLKKIAELAETESTPQEFLNAAMQEVAALPWVSGGAWKTDDTSGEFGLSSPHQAHFDFHDFSLKLHTRRPLSPALLLHIKLQTLILGEFHEAKRREQLLREQAYMKAVHETGSRMTHDIKNLLQSMRTLCSAAQELGEQGDSQLITLLQRQLPLLNRRLEMTLDKLQAPETESIHMVMVSRWWRGLKQRFAGNGIRFTMRDIDPETLVNAEVMDNVADNLLQNALEKARVESDLEISVRLRGNHGLQLEVADTGSAIPDAVAQQLFKGHVPSENGLGIGLYHAARQARQAGYALTLENNTEGDVSFMLHTTPEPAGGGASA